jgi:hypothetical protein
MNNAQVKYFNFYLQWSAAQQQLSRLQRTDLEAPVSFGVSMTFIRYFGLV